ncbi:MULTISPECIES: anaerobic C4-dicarboxylate transporter [unclassified Pseudodesulfovibrio]|uniref:anaerobic C4-dicarboxylate transporter family protein n=1 Tax=unclassified Pseudodesulfovibrio TaxID=2661612 RepID=UPI000FEC076E|nr:MULTISPECIES: anaerobic C4-dicarboxylate transporter [unclassified Pseudodesulfovibrio]MCJ2163425.1 anaerobic C4-dicarboxylate transporter [Pseudodesulfovibrio sp. S3-i]RWU06662.1 anaerobic C4-dicarboxylate transporter [Pseudodesulfovibrio sp. S3]
MFWIELLVVLAAIFIGARLGGVGLGVMGGVGLAILTFVFGVHPTAPPIDVMLMITAVVTAAGTLQAAGGLDFLVEIAAHILKRNPSHITYLGPIVTYVFTFFAGTGHVAYSVLPVIAEVARSTGIRPERPLSISVIASQQAITASPISAATVALLGLTATAGVELSDILMICVPATFVACMVGAFFVNRMGKELATDPEYLKRLGTPELEEALLKAQSGEEQVLPKASRNARYSVGLFLLGTITIVLLGSFPGMRPTWTTGDGAVMRLAMSNAIEIVMLTVSGLILLISRVKVQKVATGSVFMAGMQAVIAIFGIAWLGDSFFSGNMDMLGGNIRTMVTSQPWTFAIALFILSILLFSQAATVRALMPLGIALGIPTPLLLAMFPAVNGYFFIPNYPTVVAAINFDQTGTTHIGKYVLNHSFMLPGLIATSGAVAIGFVLAGVLL